MVVALVDIFEDDNRFDEDIFVLIMVVADAVFVSVMVFGRTNSPRYRKTSGADEDDEEVAVVVVVVDDSDCRNARAFPSCIITNSRGSAKRRGAEVMMMGKMNAPKDR